MTYYDFTKAGVTVIHRLRLHEYEVSSVLKADEVTGLKKPWEVERHPDSLLSQAL